MTRLEGPYHQWQLNEYLSCPQALLLRLEGVEPLFRSMARCRGSAVHAAIHRLHAAMGWEDWEKVFEDAWREEFGRPGPPVNGTSEKIEQEYRDWKTAMGSYVAMEREAPVLFHELPVRGVVTSRSGRKYILEGTIDQIRRSDDEEGYDVYEMKTSASLPGWSSLERNVQLCLYCWCAVTGEVRVNGQWIASRKVLPGFLRNCVVYKLSDLIPYKRAGRRRDGSRYAAGELRGDPRVALPVKAEQLVEGTQAIARIIAALRAGGFFWNPSSRYGGCDSCAYKYACGTTFTSNREALPEPVASLAQTA